MFGVDIQPIAIQITKLRFFIALIVEQDRDESKPNLGIRALPNLETKFVAANTLIGLAENNRELLGLEDENVQAMKKELWDIRERHFYAENAKKKNALRDEDENKRDQIKQYLLNTAAKPNVELIRLNTIQIAELESLRKEVETEIFVDVSKDNSHLFDDLNDGLPQYIDSNADKRASIDAKIKRLRNANEAENNKSGNKSLTDDIEKIAGWDPYDQSAKAAHFFDPYWMFGVEKGFDVVIGNPPYVRADNPVIAGQRENILQSGQYETLWEKWDLMVPFFEKGLKMVNAGGFLTLIASNAITTSKYAEKLQAWIIDKHFVRSIDYFENIKVFEAGVVPVVISVQANMKDTSKTTKTTKKIYRKDTFDNAEIIMVRNDGKNLQSKVFRKSFSDMFNPVIAYDKLGDICYLSVGMVINADEKTVKGEFVKDDLISDTKDEIHCKEYVEGKNIGAYRIDKIKYLEYNTKRVPSQLRRPTFENLFTGEKILRGRVTKGTFDNTGIVCNDSIIVFKRFFDLKGIGERSISVSISKNNFEEHGSKTTEKVKQRRSELEKLSEDYSLKYILALINSSYAMAYLNNYRRHRLENYFYPDDFRKFPIAKIPPAEQKPFIDLVDQILAAKAADPKTDTSILERQIDRLVYRLYDLSWDEVRVIEPGFPLSRAEYEGME
jgi:adenine-specific DNA-methyltransferase